MKNLQIALTIKQLYQMKASGQKYTNIQLQENKQTSLKLPESLGELSIQANRCHLCELSKSRTNVLFGEGGENAKIMFIGNSPNATEDSSGSFFAGRAGEMLENIIVKVLGLSKEDVYVTNIVKCYPPQNRTILEGEAITCKSYLDLQIKTINPKIIVALGDEAYYYLTGDDGGIENMYGNFINKNNYIIVPMFSPSAMLKNPSYKKYAMEYLLKIKSYIQN